MSVNTVITDNSSNTMSYILKEIELLKTNINNLLYFCPSHEKSSSNFNSLKDCSGVSIHTVISLLLQDKFLFKQNTLKNNYNESSFQNLLDYRDYLNKKLNEQDVSLVSLLDSEVNNNSTLINWLSNIKISDMRNLDHGWWKTTVPPEISLIMLKFYENTLKKRYDTYIHTYHQYQHFCSEIGNLEKKASELLKEYKEKKTTN